MMRVNIFENMKKTFFLPITAFLLLFLNVGTVFAQQFSIIPYTTKTQDECRVVMDYYEVNGQISTGDPAAAKNDFTKKTSVLSDATDANKKAEADLEAAQKDTTLLNGSLNYAIDQNRADVQKYITDNNLCDTRSTIVGTGNNQKVQAPPACKSGQTPYYMCDSDACKESNKIVQGIQKDYNDASAKAQAAAATVNETNKAFDNADQAWKDSMAVLNSSDVLGCAIKTGRISLAMIPYFITYVINFILSLAGLICVFFIVIGGYHYVYGGLVEDKEKGKNTIKHALMGLALALLAWTIVSVLIRAVTG